jgi:uncharacterized protein (DUF2249 family)/quercetin dioxygenase-like cupin family protein
MRDMNEQSSTQKTSLTALARRQLEQAREAPSGRSAETVTGGHDHVLRQTVIALTAGTRMDEHDNPGDVTVQILDGRVVLTAGDASWSGWRSDLLAVPNARHALEAIEDSVVLLTVAVPIAPEHDALTHRPEPVALGKRPPTTNAPAPARDAVTLDARLIPKAVRHAAVFGALGTLPAGAALDVLEPHDPQRMLAELEQGQPGAFSVDFVESGPEVWRVRFTRA